MRAQLRTTRHPLLKIDSIEPPPAERDMRNLGSDQLIDTRWESSLECE
jgi:hypothetical protein